MKEKRIAVFASGSGTNAENMFNYFSENEKIMIDSLWANKASAYALERAKNHGVETFVFNREQFYNTDEIVQTLRNRKVDIIVLAGFLWLIPEKLIETFTIINIHPALLPKYGGKGMYGMKVHEAVVENKEPYSGITIHYVNQNYDEGKIIFQAKCEVHPDDTPEIVAQKVHELEYRYFPSVVEDVLRKMDN
ncbi:MAG TPA: phosphoribosylglycinamide formyltransferase [Draconibacterium sp.]|nr:phosphoribosylglycinamide formyltransferase [Draconibacterium sp.]